MSDYLFETRKPKKYGRNILLFLLVVVGVVFILSKYCSAPNDMPTESFIRVSPGESVVAVSADLYDKHYIRSTTIFQSLFVFLKKDKGLVNGDYYFDARVPVWVIVFRMASGHYNIAQIKITFWEGIKNSEIASIVGTKIPSIQKADFLAAIDGKQGYLFPDTYFISPFALAEDIVQKLSDNFTNQTRGLEKDIASSGHTKQEIVTMASIIEKESNGHGDRAVISGILWNRIKNGQRLQVDAPLTYLLGRESKNLTSLDLKLDSPYNTYVHKGLPPGPISNPGIESIKAALYPAQTDFVFYLHAPDGTFYGAKTYADHLKNIHKYLR